VFSFLLVFYTTLTAVMWRVHFLVLSACLICAFASKMKVKFLELIV